MSGLSVLLNNVGADTGVDITGDWVTWNGGPGDFWAWGDLGGGTIRMEAALLESAPVTICGMSLTDITTVISGVIRFDFNHGTRIRAVVSGTTSPSSGIYAKVN